MLNATTQAESVRKNSEFSHIKTEARDGGRMRVERTADDPAEGVNLGINARTEANQQWRGFQTIDRTTEWVDMVNSETGEIVRFSTDKHGNIKPTKTHQETRAERYALKSVVNRIFPASKTAKCSRMRIPGEFVKVMKSPEYEKAHYAGLVRCGSVWWCPLCAAKIAERRRVELVSAIATAKAMGLQVLLMTATVPHGLGDDINVILEQMMKAWRKTTTERQGKEMRKLLGFVGTIRALEVTDGQNGFHPHFHVLIFAKPDFAVSAFQTGFYPIWRDNCIKAGLPAPSEKHGLRVDDGSWAAKYASKWGLEDEMTRSHTKSSKGEKGRSPWDMLREALKSGCEASIARFSVYAHAFKGRRQLYWSNGLRELLGLDKEATDEELAAMQEETAVELAQLSVEEWRAVMFTRSEAAVLDLAERDPGQIPVLLASLVATSTHSVQPGVVRPAIASRTTKGKDSPIQTYPLTRQKARNEASNLSAPLD